MQIVFNQSELRAMLIRLLERFEDEPKIDFDKSYFSFSDDRHETFANLKQLALEVVPDDFS